ncbi:hypothetical protein IU397_10820 [Actibacterium sp. 188UL27-1]|nr:hypothetical protein [Actibacterium sp. 188UL27-1]
MLHVSAFVILTLLTQVGGLAWLAALAVRPRIVSFAGAYLALWLITPFAAAAFGRVPMPCSDEAGLRTKAIYCALNRHYVTPDLRHAAIQAAQTVAETFPGTHTIALDAGFPFLDGMPLLPHLSHDDGRKLDLAFYYTDPASQYLPGQTRSPLGYWAFETGPSTCTRQFPTLRWNMDLLQPLWPDRPLEGARTTALVQALIADPRIGKILIEPHLETRLGLGHSKLRFQGCRAARHDDHIHIQL